MSTRAEALDEERKKAEVSLEGLKSKLKNLEEVRLFIILKHVYFHFYRSKGIYLHYFHFSSLSLGNYKKRLDCGRFPFKSRHI